VIRKNDPNSNLVTSILSISIPPARTATAVAVGGRNDTHGCSSLQKRLIRKAIPNGGAIVKATKCPQSQKWLSEYLASAPASQDFLAMYFGCNKGYDALEMGELVSHNFDVFDKTKWGQALGIQGLGACKQGDSTSASPFGVEVSHQEKKSVEVHCIEAMPQLAERLHQAAIATTSSDHGLIVHNYAMTGHAGGGAVLFPNPDARAGTETFTIGDCVNEKMRPSCKEVNTITIDEYVEKHVDRDGVPTPSRRIPFISIDVEGSDYTLMKAATKTLKRADYLEFEYHRQGDWRKQRLQDAVLMLKEAGFVCYWAGINKLWRITDCWMDYFEMHDWSNVACVSPEHQPKLAETMEAVFEDTLVEYQ
jgi:FkbM family methyltransferase